MATHAGSPQAFIDGRAAIAFFLRISAPTASRWKAAGVLKVQQFGRNGIWRASVAHLQRLRGDAKPGDFHILDVSSERHIGDA